jgi:23S rRNA pseudouridine1911/1915/1917 synthase
VSFIINAQDPSDDLELAFSQAQNPVVRFVVGDGVWGERLDKQLATYLPEHSRGRLQGWIEQGHVRVNGQVQSLVRHKVSSGDVIDVQPQPGQELLAYSPQAVDFEVVAQSEQWLVINKPVGLVVHPGAGNWQGTLLNGLLFLDPQLAHVPRAGIVHRLDKDTSGLMVVARTETAQTHLVRQMQARTVHRQYVALCHGHVKSRTVLIDQAIGRDSRVPIKMSVLRPIAPKEAITEVTRQRLGQLNEQPVSEVVCELRTGRTHQIRVHLASLGHPLVGDTLYGGRELGGAVRQMLHARALRFEDPQTGELMAFTSELPNDMVSVMAQTLWSETNQ